MNKIQKNSAAHKALVKLVDLGGSALREQLIGTVRATRITSALLALDIEQVGGRFKVTANGKSVAAEYAGESLVVILPKVATSSTARPKLPFQTTFGAAPYREGSQDHRLIPSLIGVTRKLPSGEVVE